MRKTKWTWLIKEEEDHIRYWMAVQSHRRVAEILWGIMGGDVGKEEKIRVDILRQVDSVIEERKQRLLDDGYKEVQLEVMDVVVLKEDENPFTSESDLEELGDFFYDLQEDINDYLFYRGLTGIDNWIDFLDGKMVMRFFTLNEELARKIIVKIYGKQLEEGIAKLKEKAKQVQKHQKRRDNS